MLVFDFTYMVNKDEYISPYSTFQSPTSSVTIVNQITHRWVIYNFS